MENPKFTDTNINDFQIYFEKNYYSPRYHMVNDIIHYVAAQGLDKEKSIELLLDLLDSTEITKEELELFFADSDDQNIKINDFQVYFEENYYSPRYHMVNDIVRYVAAQGLNKEESIEILLALLYSTGITEEELERFFAE